MVDKQEAANAEFKEIDLGDKRQQEARYMDELKSLKEDELGNCLREWECQFLPYNY